MTTLADPAPSAAPSASPSSSPSTAPSAGADDGATPRLWTLAWAGALLVLGGLSLATAWTDPVPALALGVAALVPLVVARAVLRLGVSSWATSAGLASLLVLGAYVLAAGAGTSFADTVTEAVPRLLTTVRPLPVAADLLVGPLLLTALVSLLVALRVDRMARVAPVVGALVLYTAGALLTTGQGDPYGLLGAAVVTATLVGWVVLDDHRHHVGRRVALVLLAALVATSVLLVSTTVRWDRPFEPRSLVDPPTVDVVASNPMAQLGAWASDPDRPLLEASGPVVPLRLVTLDAYDGAQWSARTRYEPLADTRADPLLGTGTRTLTTRVELLDLAGRWLPSPGWPTEVSARDALVEPVSGNLYLPADPSAVAGAGAGPATTSGVAYAVTAVADEPDPARLASATVPYGDDLSASLAPYLALPPLPQQLREFADRAVTDAVTPYERAVAIERLLHQRGRLSATAVSGSQLWRISTFLLAEPGTPGARTGTAEQFATSFALLARHNGLPTRVVVGFRPDDSQAREDAGGWTVRGRHATAWAEVYFQDLGWVPFSPTDARRAPDSEEVVERGGGDEPGPGATPDDEGATTGTGDDPAGAARTATNTGPPALVVAAASGGAVLAVLLVVLLALLLARTLRSRRHRTRGAVGAWSEGRDALRLAGMPLAPHLTADQVASVADERLRTDAVGVLAERTQRSAFAPYGAGDPAPEVDGALRDVRRVARASLPRWRRWWWPFDPSVFLR